MRKPKFNKKQPNFELEIGFSQSVILFDILIGLVFLLGGAAFAYWIESLWALLIPLLGTYTIWQTIKRGFNQGPQLKIGYSGIWSAEFGFLSWTKALPVIKTDVGYRSVSTYLVVLDRVYPERATEIAKLSVRELDIEIRELQACLVRYAPKSI